MSERERWIVYPLLFFALGAAIRDKIIKEVRTDRLFTDTIRCESISIVDPENRRRILAELSSASTKAAGDGQAKRLGRLVLTDSDGREFFGLADDLLQMRDIRCESVSVINPESPNKILAQMTSTLIPSAIDGAPSVRFGVLALNNRSYTQVFGLPTRRSPVRRQPPTGGETPGGVIENEAEPAQIEAAARPLNDLEQSTPTDSQADEEQATD